MDVGHYYLEGNADVVEFCPHDPFYNVLAASTYTLQEGDQPRRLGSISLFNVDADLGRLELVHKLVTSGIFDTKWNPVGGNATCPLLAQADADGYLRVHRLETSTDGSENQGGCLMFTITENKGFEVDAGYSLKEVNSEKVSSSMCLCLDWNPTATSISVGLSNGSVSIISLQESETSIVQEWKAHDFELWATSFDPHQPQLLYTGSDDCKFSCWDLRSDPSNLAFQNSKTHKMGVCCIAKTPSDPNTLLTGSYDEHLRIWDVRSISKPIHETSLGGGVWRIKHHSFVPGLVLAACMHNGFAVVKIKGDEVKVVETYNKHESLAYGADWYKGSLSEVDNKKSTVIATCSFYDKLLRVWMPQHDIFK